MTGINKTNDPNKVDSRHKQYEKHYPLWRKCRVVADGSEAVKNAGVEFLPQLTDQEPRDYEAYKHRALFFEGMSRAISGMLGMMFNIEPTIHTSDGSDFLDRIMPGFLPVKTFLKKISREVITVGRAGLLVDVDEDGLPYIAEYHAENILNWRVSRKGGQSSLSFLVLMETVEEYNSFATTEVVQYRVLHINSDGFYTVELYRQKEKGGDEFILMPGYPLLPQKNGRLLREIPFYFINASSSRPEPERPPLIGMANVNISHYINSADLEHGRHFTGIPTPWVAGFPAMDKLRIGSPMAWVSRDANAKAGFLEFTGQGLKSLENALKEKLELMIVLGSRLLEAPKKASESADNQASRKQGEASILSNIADSVSDGMTRAVKFAAEWAGEPSGDYNIEINRDFVTLSPDAGLMREWISATQGGLISYDTFFYNLKKSGMVPFERDAETEQDLIDVQAPAS